MRSPSHNEEMIDQFHYVPVDYTLQDHAHRVQRGRKWGVRSFPGYPYYRSTLQYVLCVV